MARKATDEGMEGSQQALDCFNLDTRRGNRAVFPVVYYFLGDLARDGGRQEHEQGPRADNSLQTLTVQEPHALRQQDPQKEGRETEGR